MPETARRPFIAAAFGEKAERVPIWFMRQAGRYLPEYREIRSQLSFLDLCKTPHLAAEVTLQPLRRYDLDAAIIFSDILIPAVAMGQELTFDKGHGPKLSPAIRTSQDLQNLKIPDAKRDMGFVGEAIAQVADQLKPEQTMIGFAGAPFTVATYMIEGQGTKTFTEVKKILFTQPQLFHDILEKISTVTIDYLTMQMERGARALMLFDTWAAQLNSSDYRKFVFPHVQRIISAIRKPDIPLIYFPGQGSDNLYELNGLGVDVISIDWRTPIDRGISILKQIGLEVSVQGNLDPQCLIGSRESIESRVADVLSRVAHSQVRGHIFNVGHGLLPHTPPESLNWAIQAVRKFNKPNI